MNLNKLTFEQAHRLASSANIVRLTSAYHGALARAWQASGTKEMFLASSAAHKFPHIKARYAPCLHLAVDPDKHLARLIMRLARSTPVRHIKNCWTEFDRSSVHAYSSQGYGAEKYAECYAGISAEFLKAQGIPAKVERVEGPLGGAYAVYAETDKAGVDILLNRPGLPLREVVKHCWKQGCQPRVFFWWLPHDFETSAGLDYFGGEKATINPGSCRPVNTPDMTEHAKANNFYINRL